MSTATGKGKEHDAHLSVALRNLPVWHRMTEGNIEVNARIETFLKPHIKGARCKKKVMMQGI